MQLNFDSWTFDIRCRLALFKGLYFGSRPHYMDLKQSVDAQHPELVVGSFRRINPTEVDASNGPTRRLAALPHADKSNSASAATSVLLVSMNAFRGFSHPVNSLKAQLLKFVLWHSVMTITQDCCALY